jgi:hypothetical protein
MRIRTGDDGAADAALIGGKESHLIRPHRHVLQLDAEDLRVELRRPPEIRRRNLEPIDRVLH